MPRKSRWAHNDEMWEWIARKVKGGMSYSEVQGQLAGSERKRFDLARIPSVDTIRYQLNKRVMIGRSVSPLPPEELESHYRALTYLGNALRYLISAPPSASSAYGMPMPPSAPNPAEWRGFQQAMIFQPAANYESEEEVRDEWTSHSNTPDAFSQYRYFRQHMDCTLLGRKVNNALDAVERTANDYMENFPGYGSIASELEKKKGKLGTAQASLRAALTPSIQVRRMVQDAECDLCSSKPLERPE